MELEYIYGNDTGKEGFNKANRNFGAVDTAITTSAATTLQSAKDWATGTYSNPNLLINGGFQVWQRGESFTVTTDKYTADRWIIVSTNGSYPVTVTKNDINGGMKIVQSSNSSILRYKMEDVDFAKISGKTVTLSYNLDGVIIKSTFTATVPNIINISIPYSTTGHVLNWAKLELGSVATPFVPRSYATELALCQRYFQVLKRNTRIRMGYYNSSDLDFYYPIQEMRAAPTFALNGMQGVDYAVRTISGAVQTDFTFSAALMTKTQFGLKATKTAHGLTDGQLAIMGANGEIWLDSEIY